MRKNIQIPVSLFATMFYYVLDHYDQTDEERYQQIYAAVEKKLQDCKKHELYSAYKTGAASHQRENARNEYLDMAGILESFRWYD